MPKSVLQRIGDFLGGADAGGSSHVPVAGDHEVFHHGLDGGSSQLNDGIGLCDGDCCVACGDDGFEALTTHDGAKSHPPSGASALRHDAGVLDEVLSSNAYASYTEPFSKLIFDQSCSL